ncbi:poly-gamma-glutamate synthesis protein (capsule biosynthesis protein) [Bacillus niacini]|uniref:Poly-gamma-glutamate synthesis protein (Capsule biosynthesis protein) n=1 Tax=Neobacillus niacini TaxID=86668 RepID=A0A852T573_9BACI|nr:CapA family protein [Neobacillus niacini]NYE03860.1 poly-gamma-glutamate synthesis protein (capsule biosynthesis protein) [Neobacillus niacini]
MKKDSSILICGDLCPTPEMQMLLAKENVEPVFNRLIQEFNKSDLLIGNLEAPFLEHGDPIIKTGPSFKLIPESIKGFKSVGFQVLGMANNHIRDYGDAGVALSMQICKEKGISFVGAGTNEKNAKAPLIKNVNGWNVGFLAYAEHEFNYASETNMGANAFDLYYSFDEIRALKRQCDYVIVLYHGGIEYYQYPSPDLQKKSRRMIESGADIVLCQHSHCVGCEEKYQGGTILYGQGNTLFGYKSNSQTWNEGLLVRINLSDRETNVSYIPIKATKTNAVDLLDDSTVDDFMKRFNKRSTQILNSSFVKESWKSFCQSKQAEYLPMLFGHGRVVTAINKRVNNIIIKFFYSNRRTRVVHNLIRCEAHNEVVQTSLRNFNADN